MKIQVMLMTSLALSALAYSASAQAATAKTRVYFQQPVAKIRVPVTVKLISSDHTAINTTLPLSLQFSSDKANLPLKVEYTTDSGLTRTTPVGISSLVTNQKGGASDIVNVRASANGIYNLNVFVTAGDRTGAVSIPITVGTVTPTIQAPSKSSKTEKGEALMIMPAEESPK